MKLYEPKGRLSAPIRVTTFVIVSCTAVWAICLLSAAATARGLYADGSLAVLYHLVSPQKFNDYDPQRTFASLLIQAPILFVQRLGARSVATYGSALSLGAFVLPAMAFVASLSLARKQPSLFVATLCATVIYGFGANFMYTETNILFGLAWLSVVLLALDGTRPILRGFALPLLAFALLRVYEGMLLVGPLFAFWAARLALGVDDLQEKIGLTISALFFAIAAVIGLGGFLAPRDPVNAASFLDSVLAYLGNPQRFLLLSTLLLAPVAFDGPRKGRWVYIYAAALCALLFVRGMIMLHGYYSYSIYHLNRSFLVFSLPLAVGSIMVAHQFFPAWLSARGISRWAALLIVPFLAAAAVDLVGTYRWQRYVVAFCDVLEKDPHAGVKLLKAAGLHTGWAWNHPTLSVLFRKQGSGAVIENDEQSWQPFDPANPPTISYSGICESHINRRSLR